MPALQPYTAQGSPGGTTSDTWEDAPTTAFDGTSSLLPDSTDMLVLAIGQLREANNGSHQAELEARVGSTRIGFAAHTLPYPGGNGAAGGAQLFCARRLTTGVGESLNFRRRSSVAGQDTMISSLMAVAWPLSDIPAGLHEHSESSNDDAVVTQPADGSGWTPVGTEGGGQLRLTAAATGDHLIIGSVELIPQATIPASRAMSARLAYREVGTPTWTLVDTDDYFLRDVDDTIEDSRHCQGFSERISLTSGTEYVIAILVNGDESNGLMGAGRIALHSFAPGAYESMTGAVSGAFAVGGSATVDVAAAAVTASPEATPRDFIALSSWASTSDGIAYWTDYYLRDDNGTPGSTGDDNDGPLYGYGNDNVNGADQKLRFMCMRFLGGVASDTVITPRVTSLGGAGNSYDRVSSVAFALYAPDTASAEDIDGEASAVASATANLIIDFAIGGDAVAVAATEGNASVSSGTVEISSDAVAFAEASGQAAVDSSLGGAATAIVSASGATAVDQAVGGVAVAMATAEASPTIDWALHGDAVAVVQTFGLATASEDGMVDMSAEAAVIVDATGDVALELDITGEAASVVDVTGAAQASNTIDAAWVETILSSSEPFTTRT